MSESGDLKRALSVGCGPIRHPANNSHYWTHVDIEDTHKPDMTLDARQLHLHFREPCFSFVESTHALEHFPYPDGVLDALKSIHGVMLPGGILRIAVPDLEIACKAFAEGSDMKFLYGESFKGFYHLDCAAERFMFWAREWSHTVLFNFELMEHFLRSAGFFRIKRMAANESEIPGWAHDRYIPESLYVECRKP